MERWPRSRRQFEIGVMRSRPRAILTHACLLVRSATDDSIVVVIPGARFDDCLVKSLPERNRGALLLAWISKRRRDLVSG